MNIYLQVTMCVQGVGTMAAFPEVYSSVPINHVTMTMTIYLCDLMPSYDMQTYTQIEYSYINCFLMCVQKDIYCGTL